MRWQSALTVVLCAAALATWWRPTPVVGACEGTLVCGRPLDVNRASVEELQMLSGLGPSLSARVVDGRPFQSVDELRRVRGIGPSTLERLRPWLASPAPPPPRPIPRIDPNTASLETLESLPRVGPVLAARIAAGRPYARLEDLDRVKGIGPATLAVLGPRLALGPPAPPTARRRETP